MHTCKAIDNGLYSMAYNWSLTQQWMDGWVIVYTYIPV